MNLLQKFKAKDTQSYKYRHVASYEDQVRQPVPPVLECDTSLVSSNVLSEVYRFDVTIGIEFSVPTNVINRDIAFLHSENTAKRVLLAQLYEPMVEQLTELEQIAHNYDSQAMLDCIYEIRKALLCL